MVCNGLLRINGMKKTPTCFYISPKRYTQMENKLKRMLHMQQHPGTANSNNCEITYTPSTRLEYKTP